MSDQPVVKPPYIDDLTVREIHGELVQTIFGDDPGILRLEFCVTRWTNESPIQRRSIVPVARVAIHAGLAKTLRDQLNHCLGILEKQSQGKILPEPAGPAN